MEAVTRHSAERATEEAVRLWSFSSAQYPIQDGAVIQARLEYMLVESASTFSFNARRAMEVLHPDREFKLRQPRYEWKPTVEGEVVGNLWDALNRIIHSRKMTVGFVQLPAHMTVMTGGTYVVRIHLPRRRHGRSGADVATGWFATTRGTAAVVGVRRARWGWWHGASWRSAGRGRGSVGEPSARRWRAPAGCRPRDGCGCRHRPCG